MGKRGVIVWSVVFHIYYLFVYKCVKEGLVSYKHDEVVNYIMDQLDIICNPQIGM